MHESKPKLNCTPSYAAIVVASYTDKPWKLCMSPILLSVSVKPFHFQISHFHKLDLHQMHTLSDRCNTL